MIVLVHHHGDPDRADRAIQNGLDPSALDSYFSYDDRSECVRLGLGGETLRPPVSFAPDSHPASHLKTLPYVRTILQLGLFVCACPITGDLVSTDRGFATDPYHIAYRLSARQVFYVLVGRFHGRMVALYIPELEMLVQLDSPEGNGENIIEWARGLLAALDAALDKDAADFRTPTSLMTVPVGYMGNLGHFLWNDLQGLHDCLSSTGWRRPTHVIYPAGCWIKPSELFAEHTDVTFMEIAPGELQRYSLSFPSQYVRPIGIHVEPEFRRRLIGHALRSLSHQTLRAIVDAAARTTTLWITVRAHNKRWNDQIEGYRQLIADLAGRRRRLTIVFDGTADAEPVARAIIEAAPDNVSGVSTFGCPLEESIAWSLYCQSFVQVVGSGLALNTWIAGRPGVAHGNVAHLAQAAFWDSVAIPPSRTVFVPFDKIRDAGGLYDNYDMDVETLIEAMRELVPAEQLGEIE